MPIDGKSSFVVWAMGLMGGRVCGDSREIAKRLTHTLVRRHSLLQRLRAGDWGRSMSNRVVGIDSENRLRTADGFFPLVAGLVVALGDCEGRF